ncbi:PhzF family phenazine biosynthesis protein [Alkalicella caledoniensis]|uniref:PhzF family phenazine biosynthesis protein n=1 Tax=Alkalicella caledoniensis TaxID=2731377 RepID=A0A7G9W9Z1_ALKCA|nr:PhzF family phenazine biosynthesis protein [Alkalicella caledoniensis]QNO15503.1 PhzF family phenazine biosynthesis protein [Alkalicella caledoniensis]
MKIYKLTSFTDNVCGGNLAGVVLGADDLEIRDMLRIAGEVGYSETAFVMESTQADFKVRFFTPTEEVDLCGHATIAVFNLLRELEIVSVGNVYTQETKAGILNVFVTDCEVLMEQNLPIFGEIIPISELLDCFNNISGHIDKMPIQIVSTGLRDILLPIKSLEKLLNLEPNVSKIKDISQRYNVIGIHAFTLETLNRTSAHTRNFAPLYGIDEESATGTSNGALACYLHEYLNTKSKHYVMEQGYCLNRPSIIKVELSTTNGIINTVKVGGSAVII